MFVTEGPIDPESRLFVGRARELRRMEGWLSHDKCVGAVLGARQTGKTSLLLKLRHMFRDKYAFAFVDLQAVEGASVAECFAFITEEILGQLSPTVDGDLPSVPKDGTGFSTFLQQFARVSRTIRIIVILDELGSLPPATAVKLASTIRSVFTDRHVKPEFAHYRFILAGATDMLELTCGRNSPLWNVTDSIYLGDLAPAETAQLLLEVFGEERIQVFAEMTRHLHTWTEGHPYWTQLLAATLETQLHDATDASVANVVERLLRTEDKNLPHVFHSLQADKALWNMFEAVLEGVPLRFARANAAVAKLELIGVLKEREGHCAIRNRIYRQAMQGHQTSELHLWRTNLNTIRQRMFAATEMKSLLHVVASYLQQTLQNRAVVIFTRGANNPNFTATANVGIADELLEGIRFEPECRLIHYLGTAFDPQECDLPNAEREQLRDLKSSLIVPVRLRDEPIGFLSLGRKVSGDAYDAQTLEFLATVADQTAADIDRLRLLSLQHEALEALEIQLRLLPKEIPQVPGYQISGAWKPTQLVSGDYYDVLKFGDHSVGLCIGDVVGHGLPAAMLMSNLQAAVRAFASETIGPSQLCRQVNRLLARNIGVGKFITFFYALVDAGSNRLLYTNAGHNAPILLRPTGEVLRLDEGGTLLGVFPEVAYRQEQVELAHGDRLLIFTDGVSEAQNTDSEEFGEARLIEVLTNNRSRDAIDIQKAVIQAVTEFSNGDFHDDVTTLVLAVL